MRTSETCKFTPDKQHQLIELRRRLMAFEEEYTGLCDLLSDGPLASGLPLLKDEARCRLHGTTFSVEDAKRELCNEWYKRRLGDFVNFVDKALADQLDRPK